MKERAQGALHGFVVQSSLVLPGLLDLIFEHITQMAQAGLRLFGEGLVLGIRATDDRYYADVYCIFGIRLIRIAAQGDRNCCVFAASTAV